MGSAKLTELSQEIKVKFHFRWGTKPLDQKQNTRNECDVISGPQAKRETDFSDIFLFSYKQCAFGTVVFNGERFIKNNIS